MGLKKKTQRVYLATGHSFLRYNIMNDIVLGVVVLPFMLQNMFVFLGWCVSFGEEIRFMCQ